MREYPYPSTRRNDEEKVQMALVEHLKLRAEPGVVWYMIRNHGKRGVASLKKDAAMGLRKGAADLGFILPPHGLSAMLELKVGKNTPSAEQEQFGADVEAAGAYYACAWGIDQALGILAAWGVIR